MENYENRFCFTARYNDDTTINYPADTPDACISAFAIYAADPDCVFFEAYDLMDDDSIPFLSFIRPHK